MQLITDIPYLSFPIRSIDNWIDRLLSPSYIKLMSDLMDGIYSQFEDEDGQYDEFTKFQMMNGWIPIGNSFGLRVGHVALDLHSILSNPPDLIGQRMNPILRCVQTLINNGDFVESIKRLATTGALTRVANMVGPRETLQQTPVVQDFVTKKPRSVGTTLGFTYDRYEKDEFTKYTPYNDRNGNNGRYTRYENIYRDWFNKYGRMRKPKVDPMSIVKDIQWRQYVRWRRSNNMT